jgi:hypothetical protein
MDSRGTLAHGKTKCRGSAPDCAQFTANSGGVCAACLPGGRLPRDQPKESKKKQGERLSRQAHAVLSVRPRRSVPIAIERGRGL